MRVRWFLNLVLLLAVAGLGWWVYLETQPAGASNRIAVVPEQGLSEIVIVRRGEKEVRLRRGERGWQLLAPRQLAASEFHVQLIERFLASPVVARYPRAGFDLAAAGLLSPKLTLVFDGKTLVFGGMQPLDQLRYLLFQDEVLLVQDGVSAILGSPWWNFIDRRLLPEGAEVVALEFADGRRLDGQNAPRVLARWQDAMPTMVKPQREGVRGEEFVVLLESGERLHWQWLEGEQPRLLRPDLGLAYHVSAETLAVLLGRQKSLTP